MHLMKGFSLERSAMYMFEVIPHLYLGIVEDAMAVDSRRPEYSHIDSVLSLCHREPNWRGALKSKLRSWVVVVCDLPTEDLLTNLPQCVEFIHEEVSEEKSVLVHCSQCVSRSPAVVMAYLMWSTGISAKDALKKLQDIQPDIRPNVGFMFQLKLWETMKCSLDEGHKQYKAYRLQLWARKMKESGYSEVMGLAADPGTGLGVKKPGGAGGVGEKCYKCRKCRRCLFAEGNILQHELGMGQESFKWHKREVPLSSAPQEAVGVSLGVPTPLFGPDGAMSNVAKNCTSHFIEPIEWMGPVIMGTLTDTLSCPKCSAKLGSFNWAGSQCSCGRWVTPSFQLHKTKVD